jgi:hypothetical protein
MNLSRLRPKNNISYRICLLAITAGRIGFPKPVLTIRVSLCSLNPRFSLFPESYHSQLQIFDRGICARLFHMPISQTPTEYARLPRAASPAEHDATYAMELRPVWWLITANCSSDSLYKLLIITYTCSQHFSELHRRRSGAKIRG